MGKQIFYQEIAPAYFKAAIFSISCRRQAQVASLAQLCAIP